MKRIIFDILLGLLVGVFLIFLKGYEFNPVLFILLILLSIVIFFKSFEKFKLEKQQNDDLNEKILEIKTSIAKSNDKICNGISNVVDTLSKDIHYLESTNNLILSDINNVISMNIKEMNELLKRIIELDQANKNSLKEKMLEITASIVKSNEKIHDGISGSFRNNKKRFKNYFF